MNRRPECNLTIAEAYDLWSDRFRETQSPATRRLRHWQFQWWEKYSYKNPALKDITRKTFLDFRKRAIADGLSVETVETCLNSIVSVLNEARRRKFIAELPERPRRMKGAPRKAPAATLEEFVRFCRYACRSK